MKKIIGVSTACLYPALTEDALEALCSAGVKHTEIFINSDCEIELDFLTNLKNILDSYGSKCVSLHPYTCGIEPMMFFTHYPRRFYDILEYYKKYFEAMNILGAKNFVFHGNQVKNIIEDNLYFERYLGLYELGCKFGISVSQENVERCTSGSLEFLCRMKKALGDSALFTLDTKQAVRRGYEPYEFLDRLGSSIRHIHISDHDDNADCLPVGKGVLNFKKFLSKLFEIQFDGHLMLELYRNNFDDVSELYDNYVYMKSLCQPIQVQSITGESVIQDNIGETMLG